MATTQLCTHLFLSSVTVGWNFQVSCQTTPNTTLPMKHNMDHVLISQSRNMNFQLYKLAQPATHTLGFSFLQLYLPHKDKGNIFCFQNPMQKLLTQSVSPCSQISPRKPIPIGMSLNAVKLGNIAGSPAWTRKGTHPSNICITVFPVISSCVIPTFTTATAQWATLQFFPRDFSFSGHSKGMERHEPLIPTARENTI